MMKTVIDFTLRGPTAWITLNRPADMNALNRAMLDALETALQDAETNDEIRVLVLTGAGRAFCAGGDLKEVLNGAGAEPGEADFLDRAEAVFNRLRRFPKPTIAAVNGLALAGGLELTLACDLVVAAESAKLGDAHANFGVFPGAGGAAVLARKLPLNVAKYLLFTGEALPADELRTWGLVNDVVPDGQLHDTVERLAARLAEKSPLVLTRMKRVANESSDKTLDDALRQELSELRRHMRSYDIQEGLRAFSEKRKPQFRGR